MPILEKSQLQQELERQEELEDREHAAGREASKQEHELRLAKLRYQVQPRHKAVARCVLAIAKAPALCILVMLLPMLTLADKEIPEQLYDFLNL